MITCHRNKNIHHISISTIYSHISDSRRLFILVRVSLSSERGVVLGHNRKWYAREENKKGFVVCWYVNERY